MRYLAVGLALLLLAGCVRPSYYGQTSSLNTPGAGYSAGNTAAAVPVNSSLASSSSSTYCREYRQSIKIGDQEQEIIGTACRQPDGSWKVLR